MPVMEMNSNEREVLRRFTGKKSFVALFGGLPQFSI